MSSTTRRAVALLGRLPVSLRVAISGFALALALVAVIETVGVLVLGLQNPELARGLADSPTNLAMSVEVALKAVPAGLMAAMGVPVEWSATLVATRSGDAGVLSTAPSLALLALAVPFVVTTWMGRQIAGRGSGALSDALVCGVVFAIGCSSLAPPRQR